MPTGNPSRSVRAIFVSIQGGEQRLGFKPHSVAFLVDSVKIFDRAYLPLSSCRLMNKVMLNRSSMPGGISSVENSVLSSVTQRRTGTREMQRTLSI